MDDQLSGGDEDALDRELEELQRRRHAKTPDSKAARELDADATSTVEAYVAQLEYAARLAVGVWDGDSDARFASHLEDRRLHSREGRQRGTGCTRHRPDDL